MFNYIEEYSTDVVIMTRMEYRGDHTTRTEEWNGGHCLKGLTLLIVVILIMIPLKC